MDLSNLSSNLPLSQPIDDDSVEQINRELSNEFKLGARSIAALYRLSNAKNSLLKAKGYLSCLDDILNLIDNDQSIATLDQLKKALMTKKTELTGKKDKPHKPQEQQEPAKDEISTTGEIPADYKFHFSSDTPSPHFPPSKLPLSIQHCNVKHISHHSSSQQLTNRLNKLKENFKKAVNDSNDEDSEDAEHSESDESMVLEDCQKRRRLDTHAAKKNISEHDHI
ncbi:hypothetical protein KL905_000651 [Ogataea polymorpha]|nr:hypothetical protein KL905_000651 [Ogataea polymorpha]KAG7931657.1 hypothetical protein KL934_004069 [Ogataea polymorpha]